MVATAMENLRRLQLESGARTASRPALPAPTSPTDPAKPRSPRKKPSAKKALPDLSEQPVLETKVALDPPALEPTVAQPVEQTVPPLQARAVQTPTLPLPQAHVEPEAKPRRKFSLLRALAEFDVLHAMTLTVALVLATIAAYFSVTGMSKIFPGSESAIIVMASTMEGGKLIGAAWLSRYWREMSWLLRGVLTMLVVVLATTNAVGVFGQLSAAHLSPHLNAMALNGTEAAQMGARIEVQNTMIADLSRRINQIDGAIEAATKHGRAASAMDLLRDQRKNRADLVQQRSAAEATLVEFKTEQARLSGEQQKAQADIGILEYAATLFGIERERMIQLLIFAMVLSCDPLSITLVVAAAGRRKRYSS
jgi:hypothetical protein